MFNEPVHEETIGDYLIQIHADTDAQNPFEDWDCEPPLAVYSAGNRGIQEYGEVNTVPTLSREQIKANIPAICSLLDAKSLLRASDRLNERYSDSAVDQINYVIERHINDLGNSDRLEALCELYNIAGIPAVCGSVHGYSQGDYAEVLAVATPEFQEMCGNGADFDWIESLKGSVQLFEDWAFGNVYGYTVTKDGEDVDSCWGFFGDYDAPYSALSEAQAYVTYAIAKDRKNHFEQVKTWIKNRVPLQYRVTA